MTRDEALKLLDDRQYDPKKSPNEYAVDSLVALGILKLDEPKPIGIRFGEALKPCGIQIGVYEMEAIDAAGLRIVEK